MKYRSRGANTEMTLTLLQGNEVIRDLDIVAEAVAGTS